MMYQVGEMMQQKVDAVKRIMDLAENIALDHRQVILVVTQRDFHFFLDFYNDCFHNSAIQSSN